MGVQDRRIDAGNSFVWNAVTRFSHTSYWGTSKRVNRRASNESRSIIRQLAIRQNAALIISGSIADLKRLRGELASSQVDFTPSSARLDASDELIELRVLRVSETKTPKRDWTWLGMDSYFAPAHLPRVLEALSKVPSVSAVWAGAGGAEKEQQEPATQYERTTADDSRDAIEETPDPYKPEPTEE
jgi:hypothetical protein